MARLPCRMQRFEVSHSLCSSEIYTIQGNSHGRPCYLPFLYDGQWFHNCTSIGREDGHLWCATTFDYGKDEHWGFCPVKSELSLCTFRTSLKSHLSSFCQKLGELHHNFLSPNCSFYCYFIPVSVVVKQTSYFLPSLSGKGCETFWDTDPLTDSCYQFNFQATLSWSEARISCQQQGADLLSITKLHEQTYINGKVNVHTCTFVFRGIHWCCRYCMNYIVHWHFYWDTVVRLKLVTWMNQYMIYFITVNKHSYYWK